MGKIIKKGLLIGVVNLVMGIVLNQVLNAIFPELLREYQNGALFRPWTDPLMMAFFLYPFILGMALAYFWSIFGKQIKGETVGQKAWSFTKLYFVIATIPGMFISLTSFKVSFLMIGSWTFSGLAEAFIAGWILAKS